LFQGLLDIIHYLTQHTSLLVNVISVIHAQNAPELPELVELLCRQPRFGAFNFQAIVPTVAKPWSDEFFAQDPLWPRTEPELTRVLTALDRLEQLQRDGRPINNPPAQFAYWRRYFRDPRHFASREPCLVGDEAFNVGVTGEVTLCHHLGRLGMIDDDPRTLWESPDAAAMRAAMRACPRACNYRVNCCYVDDAAEPASLGGT
jgi:MoaA/NifB/PqqE/SkfB family radical SAM enzyme